jgi:hypothetical protein
MSERQKALAANMWVRGESFEDILKYINQEEGLTVRKNITELGNNLVQRMTDPIYYLNLELAQTNNLIDVASEKAEKGSPRHMSEFAKLSTHKIKLVKQLAELEEIEESKGRTWTPSFDEESNEFLVFKAFTEAYLTQESDEKDSDFDQLSIEEQARFLKIMAESE